MPLAVRSAVVPVPLQIISFCGFMIPSSPGVCNFAARETARWSEFKDSTGLPFHSADDVGIGAAWHRVGICR
jgi:hypothetical protein